MWNLFQAIISVKKTTNKPTKVISTAATVPVCYPDYSLVSTEQWHYNEAETNRHDRHVSLTAALLQFPPHLTQAGEHSVGKDFRVKR